MAATNPIVNLIVEGARARGLDPAAVLAVASQEGLSGRIGDGGHAYGPFQLNNAGGVITDTHPGVNDPGTQAWASSPAGINFALDRIAAVAKGQHGQQAVNSIVTQFERPANPGREVAGASAAYGSYSGGAAQAVLPPGAPQQPAQAPVARPTPGSNDLAILNQGAKLFGLPPMPSIAPSAPLRQPTTAAQAPAVFPLVRGTKAGGFLPADASYVPGRIDQGHDFQTIPGGAIVAPGAGTVVKVLSDPNGFGPSYPVVHFTTGPYAGKTLYIGHTLAALQPGQSFQAGQTISHTGTRPIGNASVPGWAEIGFAPGGVPGGFGQHAPF